MEPIQFKHDINEREERNRLIIESARDYAILTVDFNGRIESWSPGAEAVFGWPEDEAIGQPMDITFTPEDRAECKPEEELETARREGTSPDIRWHLRKDGSKVYIEGTTRALHDEDGHVTGFLKIGQDVTERKKAESALQASESRFQTMFQIGTVGIVFFDDRGAITDANDAFLQMIGFTRSELEAGLVRYDELTPPEWLWKNVETLAELKRTGQSLPFEKEYFRKDGSRIWIMCANKSLSEGSAVEFVLDITERKRAEAALTESEARFRAVADMVPDLLWQNDPSGTRTWGNQRWMEYTGQTPDEALGDGWTNTIHPDDRDSALHAYREALASGHPYRHEHRIRRADGAYKWFLAMMVPVRDDSGKITQWFGAAADVDAQKTSRGELEALVAERTLALEQRNRELQQFAFVASHDLQEPLRKIQTFAGMMQAEYGQMLDPTAHNYLDRMEKAATRMSDLLRDMLSFSRVSTRMSPFRRVRVDAIAREVLQDLDTLIEGSSARVDVSASAEVEVDPGQLRQLLNHLILNSVKFQRAGNLPHIHILASYETRTDGTLFCRIEVADNGIGFDERFAERIFEPFQRLQGRSEYPGTGMGLAICRRIAERHGGTIRAESKPGEGSRFVIELPVTQLEKT